MQKTPLAEVHEKSGAKMVDFAGWYMPVQYKGLREEHNHCRTHVGLFDVSHMGEIRVKGPKAVETLQWLTTNDVSTLQNGMAQYSLLPNFDGGLVDDLYVYCIEEGRDYLLCVNAANADKDWAWIQKNNKGAELKNESSEWGQIAVQGPKAIALLVKIFGGAIKDVAKNRFIPLDFQGKTVLAAHTGYTGEEGFEIFIPADKTVALWNELMSKGAEFQAEPIGLGARDTLRTEMKYSLYGHEIDDLSNPYEAGLGWVIKADKKDFIGKDKIVAVKNAGLRRKLVGFKMIDRGGIPRQGYRLLGIDNVEIGKVTSGTVSPTIGESIGIGYVLANYAVLGTEIFVDIRGRSVKAQVAATPFVNKIKGA